MRQTRNDGGIIGKAITKMVIVIKRSSFYPK